jgi:hypothetical protein
VEIRRVRLIPEKKRHRLARLANFVYFLARAVLYAVSGRKYDVVIASSHPPVLMGCALRIIHAFSGTPYIYHCMDIHPEAAALAGDLNRGRLYRLLMRWDIATCRKAFRTVVLSQDMAHTLAGRGISSEKIAIINNPPLDVDATAEIKLPPPLDERSDTVRFLFAGNCGRFQGLERLIAATKQVSGREPFQLVFMGEGSAKRELIRLAGDELNRRIFFVAHQPTEIAFAAMCNSDYGIVSLLSDVFRCAYPSKSMTYWAAGCPVVALVEPQSELATTIGQHRLGLVSASKSVTDIADVITSAVNQRRFWSTDERRRIQKTCRALFGTKRMLAAWDELLPGADATEREPSLPRSVVRHSPADAYAKRRRLVRSATPCQPSMHK